MNLDLNLRMEAWRDGPAHNVAMAQKAEQLGYRSVWTEEAYGNDAVVPLAWIGANTRDIGLGSAIWQISARTPAATAMTAATLDLFSEGRLRVGLGVSGPQVVEGWHGRPFTRPLRREREYIEIIRRILLRDKPVSFDGEIYQLPTTDGIGQGKPLKLILRPYRNQIPIYIGAMGPQNVELTAEIADGWLPIFMIPEQLDSIFGEALEAGFAKSDSDKSIGDGFDVAPTVHVTVGDDVDACRAELRSRIALYIGGMGSEEKNFSNSLMARLGYEDVAQIVQKRFLDGDRRGAEQAVSDELIDQIGLVGPPGRIEERLEAWRCADSITSLIVDTTQPEAIELMAELNL